MNEITFIVEGQPFGKQRARTYTTNSGYIRTVTPDKTRTYESMIARAYKIQCSDIYFIGEIEVIINAFYKIPKSWSKMKKEWALNGEIRPQTKPDISNVIKSVEDALNKVAYDDDSSITDIHGHKWYSNEPRVEITIIGEIIRG